MGNLLSSKYNRPSKFSIRNKFTLSPNRLKPKPTLENPDDSVLIKAKELSRQQSVNFTNRRILSIIESVSQNDSSDKDKIDSKLNETFDEYDYDAIIIEKKRVKRSPRVQVTSLVIPMNKLDEYIVHPC